MSVLLCLLIVIFAVLLGMNYQSYLHIQLARKKVVAMSIVSALILIAGYAGLGSFQQQRIYQQRLNAEAFYQGVIKQTPAGDMQALKKSWQQVQQRLDNYPQDTLGWYVLGQFSVGLNKNTMALTAFRQANQLEPGIVDYQLALAQTLYHQIQQDSGYTAELQQVLGQILQQDPSHMPARHLQAGLNFIMQDYLSALHIWQGLRLEQQSVEQITLLDKMIAKAKTELLHQYPDSISITVSSTARTAGKTLFIAVKKAGQKMPVWADKIMVKKFPVTVKLNATHALAQAAALEFGDYLLEAHLSGANNPIKKANDLQGHINFKKNHHTKMDFNLSLS